MDRILWIGVVTALVIVASACSSGPSAEVEAYCDNFVAAEAAFNEGDPTEIATRLDELDASAPADMAGQTKVITSTARTALETGDFSLFEGEEFIAAEDSTGEYRQEECGYEVVEVKAVNYEFTEAPTKVKAGTIAIEFTNDGTEAHEAAVVRVNDGVTESLEEILALPEEEAMERITFIGNTFAMPGDSSTGIVEVAEPGDYAFICFVPVGSTPDNPEADGPPHASVGMISEFTIDS